MKKKHNYRLLVSSVAIVFLTAVLFIKFSLIMQSTYEATDEAREYILNPADGVTVEETEKTIVFTPENPDTAFIFYPGALVEPEAYAPLMEQLAENGIQTIVIKMPHYLALLDANGARGIQEQYPKISNWYIGGHSLGGAMASMYGAIHNAEYKGLVFLAAYATSDISNTDLNVMLVRGDQDHVLNMERYEESLVYLPKNYEEVVIDGGCHAFFGDYGPQDGDGTPTITVQEQTEETLEKLVDFME